VTSEIKTGAGGDMLQQRQKCSTSVENLTKVLRSEKSNYIQNHKCVSKRCEKKERNLLVGTNSLSVQVQVFSSLLL
jgi:hypothetical protein